MEKTYVDDIKLTATRNKIFTSLVDKKQLNIFEVITLSSGDYLPTQKMIEGEYNVYGGGGTTSKKHNEYNVKAETLGIGRVGARCGCVFKIKPKSWVTDNALYASKIDDSFDIDFLIHFLNFKNLNQFANTSAQPVISLKRISGITLPKINLKMQQEIVEILNRIEAGLIKTDDDKYGIKQTLNFVSSKEELSTELTHQLTLVKKLRQQLLQDAVQGKLVEQNAKDEPASELLKKIKADKEKLIAEKKLKKEKQLPPIKPEEIPFEIPENWMWCRLGEICTKVTDGFHNTPKKLSEGKIYISATHIREDGIKWSDCLYVSEKDHKELFNKAYPKRGEILITNRGAGCSTPVIIDIDEEFSFQNAALIGFNQQLVSNRYLFYFILKSRDEIMKTFVNGGLQPMLSNVVLGTIPIPFPPLAEQNRIVQKLEELMQYCNELEANIKQSESQNSTLLQQVLREALRKEPVGF